MKCVELICSLNMHWETWGVWTRLLHDTRFHGWTEVVNCKVWIAHRNTRPNMSLAQNVWCRAYVLYTWPIPPLAYTAHLWDISFYPYQRGRGHCPHNLGRRRQQDWGGTLITFKSFLCGYPSSQLWKRVQQVEADGQCATSVCRPREFGRLQMRLYKFLQDSAQHIITTTFRGFVVELRRFNMFQTCTIKVTQSSDSLLFRWEGTHVRMFKTVLNDSVINAAQNGKQNGSKYKHVHMFCVF